MQVGIVGAGTLGIDISIVFAKNNKFDVLLCSRNIESANKGKQKIIDYLLNQVKKGKISDSDAEGIINRIKIDDINNLSSCDLVIEAITEDLNQKKCILKKLDLICKKECIIASNTSSLSIKKMSEGLSRKILGMHFFNPAVVMKLVEIVKFDDSQNGDVNKAIEIVNDIEKKSVIVSNSAGFIVNRLMIPYINEAIELLRKGVASKDDIDIAMRLGANHPMGPLQLADLIGLDVILSIILSFQNEIDKDRYIPSDLLVQMVNEGKLGRKIGEGFYKYN